MLSLLFVLVFLVSLAVYVLMIVDVARPSSEAYEAAGTTKILWVLLVVLVGFLPWVIYAAMYRSKVQLAG